MNQNIIEIFNNNLGEVNTLLGPMLNELKPEESFWEEFFDKLNQDSFQLLYGLSKTLFKIFS